MRLLLRSAQPRFKNRTEAGQILAQQLNPYAQTSKVIVLALPRGGVPVGFAIAKSLTAPLDIILVRKLGVPEQPELAFGAIASGGVRILNGALIASLKITSETIETVTEHEQTELVRREQLYRNDRPPPDVRNKTVILVDDGLATGASMWAAVTALRRDAPAALIAAVPVGAPSVCSILKPLVTDLICLRIPDDFSSVSAWYEDFEQVTDEVVIDLLAQARNPQ